MGNSIILLIFIAVTGAMLLGSIAFLVMSIRNSSEKSYEEQLNALLDFDDDEEAPVKPKITFLSRWNNYWSNSFRATELDIFLRRVDSAGRDIIIGAIIVALVSYIILHNALLSIVTTIILIYLINAFIRTRNNRKEERINNQLPGFLYTLKANIQANETPERAILKIVDNTPSPLHEDVVIVKDMILSNSTFAEAIHALELRTTSPELRFLCSCLIQASGSGTNLESQISKIQVILEERAKIAAETSKALRSAMPSLIVSSIAIPVCFIASFFLNASAQDFWFHSPLSYALLIVVGVCYVLAFWGTKKQVDNVRNL